MKPGQPLRFLGWTVGSWVVLRAATLLIPSLETLRTPTSPGRVAAARAAGHAVMRDAPTDAEMSTYAMLAYAAVVPDPIVLHPLRRASEPVASVLPRSDVGDLGDAMPVWRQVGGEDVAGGGAGGMANADLHAMREPRRAAASPWSGTAWMLWRPEMAGGLAQTPLLGGSQLGARLEYRVADGGLGRIALYGRVSRALTGPPSEEAALGLTVRPGQAPIAMLAERRQRLGRGGRTGFALLLAGGVGPRELAPRLAAEGYAQAGMVGLPGLDGFADGKASVGYRLTPQQHQRQLTVGGSLSGSVQPGVGRLDVGPEMSLYLPAGGTSMRLSVEWRERILGDARPARGPAITLVSGF